MLNDYEVSAAGNFYSFIKNEIRKRFLVKNNVCISLLYIDKSCVHEVFFWEPAKNWQLGSLFNKWNFYTCNL